VWWRNHIGKAAGSFPAEKNDRERELKMNKGGNYRTKGGEQKTQRGRKKSKGLGARTHPAGAVGMPHCELKGLQ
jgi:hypothetical protein